MTVAMCRTIYEFLITFIVSISSVCTVLTNAVIIDFMVVIRHLSAVEIAGVKTFDDLFERFLNMILSYGKMSNEIHIIIIMESDKTISIKSATHKKRQTTPGQLCSVIS